MFVTYARTYSPATFGLVLICFLLPFAHVSCSGQRVATLSGIQLVVGTKLSEADMSEDMGRSMGMGMNMPREFQDSSEHRIGPVLWAAGAFLAAIAGLAVSFLKDKRGWMGGTIAAIAGVVMLLLLKLQMDSAIAAEGEGILEIQYAAGYGAALLVLVGAAALHGFLLFRTKTQAKGRFEGIVP